MTKQNFLGLVKIVGVKTDAYNDLAKDGKLVFAHLWDSETDGVKANERFIINANGVEYNIATEDVFKSLEERVANLEALRPDVDSSIDRLDSSVSALETLLAGYSEWKTNVDASIDRLDASVNALDASVEDHETRIKTLEGANNTLAERIADVSQDVIDISAYVHTTVNASIDTLQAKDTEIDSSITDISARLSESLKSAEIASAAAEDNSTLITLTTTDNASTVSNTTVKVSGSEYVKVEGTANNVTLSVTTASVATAGVGEGLADAKDVKDYVDGLIQDLEGALVFKGGIDDAASIPADASKGDTYVAQGSFEVNGEEVESGDLIIYGDNDWVVVQRNLDGAVTANAALDSSHLVIGTGAQGVKTIGVTVEGLETAIANANSAIQEVNAAATQNTYVTISVEDGADPSTKDVSAVLSVVDTSAKLSTVAATGSLVDALAVKEFVEGEIAAIPEVEMTLDSSTPTYVTTSATVSNGAITAEVGVKTATLADASNGSTGLATAEDVYAELSKVEEVTATSITAMGNTLGLDSSLGVTWSAQSGIPSDATYKEAIEGAYAAAHEAGVTSFGGATGAISIDTPATDGSVAFTMDGSTLKGTVVGWSDLVTNVSNNETAIGEVSTRVNEVSTRLIDLSTYVRQTVDASIDDLQIKVDDIDSSIDRLDTSVSALETELSTYAVKSIEGEAGITTRANDEYVAVSASTDTDGKVTLDASVQLAEAVNLADITDATAATATGLATDATVKDYVAYALAWEVIE